ncbi:MAG: DUF2851 family protein [Cyclobacteriaceae bacterium]
MDELFLHFLWKYQKFNKLPLTTSLGKEITVLKTGHHNKNAGPDFLESKIKIDQIEWAGSVEIHFKASDWLAHKHQSDPSYQNVILHVVWKNDTEIVYQNESQIPTLVLSDFVDQNLEQQYRSYINQPKAILCESFLDGLPSIQKTMMLDHALTDRLESKAKLVLDILSESNTNWDQTVYQLLGKNFGFSINKEPFEKLTTLLPYKIIAKHLDNPDQVFALIFGTAGFLETPEDEYQKSLQKEFDFLSKKYRINSPLLRHQWKFSKLRPANFPTVRLAQFATFLLGTKKLLSYFIENHGIKKLKAGLSIEPAGYWKNHYDFGKKLESGSNRFGSFSIENLLINTAVPILTAYSKTAGNESLLERGVELLEEIKSEKNNITKQWEQVGIACNSAFDTQALIQQYNEFCLKKRCLHCNIGVAILNRP